MMGQPAKAGDWKAGDLAECINVRDVECRSHVAAGGRYLRKGMIYVVREVVSGGVDGVLLDVGAECGPKLAQRFRRVPPLEEADPVAKVEPVREVEPA